LYTWGDNGCGQLGDGTHTQRSLPERIALAPGVSPTAISAGYGFALAIGSDGRLYAWGNNSCDFSSAPSDGLFVDKPTPKVVPFPPGVHPVAISAALFDAFAIGSDGQLYGFGYNQYTLGDGTNSNHSSPEVVSLAPGVRPVAVSTASMSTLAIGSDGNLYLWGYDYYGQLGDGSTLTVIRPKTISLAPGVTPAAIAEGAFDSYALGSDGKLYDWGYNGDGELGQGSTTPLQRNVPGVLSLPDGVIPVSIAAGQGDAFAVASNGPLYGWGYNDGGQVGNGSTSNQTTPAVISLGSGEIPAEVGPSTVSEDSYAVAKPSTPDTDLSIIGPRNITVPAVSPAGGAVNYPPPTVRDPDDAAPPPAVCTPPSGSNFVIGNTTVTCSVTDLDDTPQTATTTFVVTVEGADVQLSHLAGVVRGVGPGTSLEHKVGLARSSLASGNVSDTCSALIGLIHEIMAQAAKMVPAGQANQLIMETQRIGAVLAC
jgi:alpha-tubulin suppressor-like RCC1 family protein